MKISICSLISKIEDLKRVSDITLGDSWGSEEDEETQKAGISLALCQTEKGKMLLEHSDLRLLDVDLKRAIEYNHQLRHPSCMSVSSAE